jgi:acyl carrier protein
MGREPDRLEPGRMTRAEFIAGLRRTLEWPELADDTELKGNEKWDSLAQVDVVMFAQDELGQTLSTTDLQAARTVGDVVRLVDAQLTPG